MDNHGSYKSKKIKECISESNITLFYSVHG